MTETPDHINNWGWNQARKAPPWNDTRWQRVIAMLPQRGSVPGMTDNAPKVPQSEKPASDDQSSGQQTTEQQETTTTTERTTRERTER